MKISIPILASAILFGVAYTQAPLYYSNQNQYFLHGLAGADANSLHNDWLANTASPTPVFDALVEFTARVGFDSLFHVCYLLLLGIYWWSLLGLSPASAQRRWIVAAILMLAHSALLRWASYRLFGTDAACYLQGWFAAQYLLGAVLQPSAFGVFLLLGIRLFLGGRPFLAAVALGGACILHATYLLPAGILAITFAGMLLRDGERNWGIGVALLALLVVSPVLIHAGIQFQPSSPEAFAEASRILAEERIPHHCQPAQWFDGIAALQLAGMLLGCWLARGTRLFPIMAVLLGGSIVLTLLQLATGSSALALLFPWRSSTILLPLSLLLILTRFVRLFGDWVESRTVLIASFGSMFALATAGISLMIFRQGYAMNPAEEPLMNHVRAHRRPTDCYLLPVNLPKLGRNRGAISTDFKPLPAQRGDARAIPVDFQRFRIGAGAAIYVDFKAIPYRDVDVLEWRRRVEWNAKVYSTARVTLDEFRERGITHVIVPRDRQLNCDGLIPEWEDENYRLLRVGE